MISKAILAMDQFIYDIHLNHFYITDMLFSFSLKHIPRSAYYHNELEFMIFETMVVMSLLQSKISRV